jgi:hypothetical protein
MAVADIVATVTLDAVLPGKGMLILGTLAVDASPDTYATGGLALAAANFASKVPLAPGAKPLQVHAKGTSGYHYEYDYANAKLKIRQSAAASNPEGELAVAAIPAAVSSDVISFIAVFEKFPSV